MHDSHDARTGSRLPSFKKVGLLVVVALLVTIIPFLILGAEFEEQMLSIVRREWSAAAVFWTTVGVLSADILLPVPSSAVNVYAGAKLGVTLGTLGCWLGLTLGASLGFGLAKAASRFWSGNSQVGDDVNRQAVAQLQRKGTIAALLITRPLPILAEACVLSLGLTGMPWRLFLPPVALANLVIAFGYSLAGAWWGVGDQLATAIILSVLIPVAMTIIIRQRLSAHARATAEQGESDAGSSTQGRSARTRR